MNFAGMINKFTNNNIWVEANPDPVFLDSWISFDKFGWCKVKSVLHPFLNKEKTSYKAVIETESGRTIDLFFNEWTDKMKSTI